MFHGMESQRILPLNFRTHIIVRVMSCSLCRHSRFEIYYLGIRILHLSVLLYMYKTHLELDTVPLSVDEI